MNNIETIKNLQDALENDLYLFEKLLVEAIPENGKRAAILEIIKISKVMEKTNSKTAENELGDDVYGSLILTNRARIRYIMEKVLCLVDEMIEKR